MSKLKRSYKKLIKFLEDYSFEFGDRVIGSHYYYNGRINGVQRVVQAIFSHKEKDCQSPKTLQFAVKHSGIPKEYFEEWDKSGTVHKDIIY